MMNQPSTEAIRPAASLAPTSSAGSAYEQPGAFRVGATAAQAPAIDVMPRMLRIANAVAAPLHQRVRRGEGGLFVINASLALKWYPLGEALGLAAVSFICLLSLYLFNDVVDAQEDRHNPKKNRVLADLYADQRNTFLAIWLFLSGLAVVACAYLDGRAAVWVLAVTLINIAYSLVYKKVPFLDVPWVGLWGAAYASIVTAAPGWIIMVGAMTAVCHVYQIGEDRAADAGSGIRTSATLAAPWLSFVQATLAGTLLAAAWVLSSDVAALTFAGFFVYWLAWRHRPRVGWVLAKAHFSIVWAYLLVRG